MNKFYKTIYTIEVLSGEPLPDSISLYEIEHEISDGNCVGTNLRAEQKEITAKEMADALYEAGSDPSFCHLDDDGNSTDI